MLDIAESTVDGGISESQIYYIPAFIKIALDRICCLKVAFLKDLIRILNVYESVFIVTYVRLYYKKLI